jgi:O-antigen chain-terminating methyltransferase
LPDRLQIIGSDLDVDRLMHEIRQNVTRHRSAGEHLPEPLPQLSDGPHITEGHNFLRLQPAFQTKSDNDYHINDLLKFHGEDFVRNSYRALLLREPDADGLAHQLQTLADGRFNKIDILAGLHYSPEGQRSGVTLRGLSIPVAMRRLGRLPVIGYLIRMIIAVLRLPRLLQNQNQFEFYSLSQQERIVAYQNQYRKDLSDAVTQILETQQKVTEQQQAIELSLRQHEELAGRHNNLEKTIEVRFAEARNSVDHLTSYTTTQIQQLHNQQQTISRRQDEERAEHLSQQQQFRTDLDGQITNQQQLGAELAQQATKQQQLRSEIDEQIQHLLLRQQRAHDELAAQENRLGVLLEEVNRNADAIGGSSFVQVVAEETDHLLDGFYASFEDQFRGDRDEVRRRLQVYVPVLKEQHITSDVLDIGCGRGEWLELLKSEGIEAQGVDRNRVFVEECGRAGLSVIEADALTHLRSLPSESLNAVTSFHLVEHLQFEILIKLLDEIVRTLRRDGLLILETPNPENLLVGSCNFYADPTHRHPIPSETLQFLLESRGFHDIKILKLRPRDEAKIDGDSEIINRFNELLYRAPDYGVIASKTSETERQRRGI